MPCLGPAVPAIVGVRGWVGTQSLEMAANDNALPRCTAGECCRGTAKSFSTALETEGKCTLWRRKSRRRTTSSMWINIGNGKGSSSWIRGRDRSTSRPLSHISGYAPALCPWPVEPKINRLWPSVDDYYCATCWIIPIRGFRFIVLNIHNHMHTHIVTKWSQCLRRRIPRRRRAALHCYSIKIAKYATTAARIPRAQICIFTVVCACNSSAVDCSI